MDSIAVAKFFMMRIPVAIVSRNHNWESNKELRIHILLPETSS